VGLVREQVSIFEAEIIEIDRVTNKVRGCVIYMVSADIFKGVYVETATVNEGEVFEIIRELYNALVHAPIEGEKVGLCLIFVLVGIERIEVSEGVGSFRQVITSTVGEVEDASKGSGKVLSKVLSGGLTRLYLVTCGVVGIVGRNKASVLVVFIAEVGFIFEGFEVNNLTAVKVVFAVMG
jgi:hypothetical protein